MSGLYIHIPFCHKRCVYCDFYLVTNLELINKFLSSLKKEISLSSQNYKSVKFDSIYFGGGTPSVLSNEQISGIIKIVKEYFEISDNAEITLEGNPEDMTEIDLPSLRHSGVNRLSLGIQSFNDKELKFLTRMHTGKEASDMLEKVNRVYDNYSIDIIYSLPGQSRDDVMNSIKILDKLNVPHISAYALTYEERTPLYKMMERGDVVKNSEDKETDLFEFVSEQLCNIGYEHYEISSFAREGFMARHNSKYWRYECYLGLGPSAHSFFDNTRWNNVKNLKQYGAKLDMNELPHENITNIAVDERKFEFVMTGLRSIGIDLRRYNEMFGENFIDKNKEAVQEITKQGLGELSLNWFKLTKKGFLLADEITAKYF
jgi:oxygen-independent coproporphyrinogen III oxidase